MRAIKIAVVAGALVLAAVPGLALAGEDEKPARPSAQAVAEAEAGSPFATTETAARSVGRLAAATDDCGAITEGTYGPLADEQVDDGALDEGESRCVTVEAGAGPHLVSLAHAGTVAWTVTAADGTVACEGTGSRSECELPATGRYTLLLVNRGDAELDYRMALIDMVGTAGCADAPGVAWDLPAVTVRPGSPLQVHCWTFGGVPGDHVTGFATSVPRVVDGRGRLCDRTVDLGCVLTGPAPYRMILAPSDTRDVALQIRRLSRPEGCPVVRAGEYGAAPAGEVGGVRCRLLTGLDAGTHLLKAVGTDGSSMPHVIYSAAGERVCASRIFCAVPTAGDYTMVATSGGYAIMDRLFATVVLPTAAGGCTPLPGLGFAGEPFRGDFRTLGEVDCLTMPSLARGAVIGAVQQSPTLELNLIDADGAIDCSSTQLVQTTCKISGSAPLRLLVETRRAFPVGAYALTVGQAGDSAGCVTLPKGAGAAATIGDRLAACFTIPAETTGRSELLALARTAGDGDGRVTVHNAAGTAICSLTAQAYVRPCVLVGGQSQDAVLRGEAGAYRVTRKTVDGAGCRAVTSGTVGGRSSTGVFIGTDDIHCYRLPAKPADVHFVAAHGDGGPARQYTFTSTGSTAVCSQPAASCHATGRAGYHVYVSGGAGAAYRLDTWLLGTSWQPSAQCPAVGSPAAGFGPLRGSLDAARTGLCRAVPVKVGDAFRVPTAAPDPYLITSGGTDCWPIEGGTECVAGTTGNAYFLLNRGARSGNYDVSVGCATPACGPAELKPVKAPAITGGIARVGATMRANPGAWSPAASTYTYQWSANGVTIKGATASSYVIPASLRAKRLTVTVTAKRAGNLDGRRTSGWATVGTGLAPKATAKPKVSGTAKVGRTVHAAVGTWSPKAGAYRYEWRLNGKLISSAPTLKPTRAMAGKKLTVTIVARRAGHADGRSTSPAVTVKR